MIQMTNEIRRAYAEAWAQAVGYDQRIAALSAALEVGGWTSHEEAAVQAAIAVAERDLRASIACLIRAELVCCDIYDRNQRDGTADLFCDGPHSICYWGEAAARLADRATLATGSSPSEGGVR